MSFSINYKTHDQNSLQPLTIETFADLNAKHYGLTDIDLLDLGRVMKETETLIDYIQCSYDEIVTGWFVVLVIISVVSNVLSLVKHYQSPISVVIGYSASFNMYNQIQAFII